MSSCIEEVAGALCDHGPTERDEIPECSTSYTNNETSVASSSIVSTEEASDMASDDDWTPSETLLNRRALHICSYDGCGASFKRRYRLDIHVRTHTGERPFICSHSGCGKQYVRKQHLVRHERSHEETKQQVKNVLCEVEGCNAAYASKQALEKHMRSHHSGNRYVCSYPGCDKSYKKHQALRVHEHEHTGILPFPCQHEGCDQRFLIPSLLKRHVQRYHEFVGYKCNIDDCGQSFAKWTQLLKHKTTAHARNYPCSQCHLIFAHKNQLKQHLKIHDPEKELHKCPKEGCPRSYLDARNLKQHLLSYHSGHRFPCTHPGCTMTFVTKMSMNRHQKVHSGAPKKRKQKSVGKTAAVLSVCVPQEDQDLSQKAKEINLLENLSQESGSKKEAAH